MFSLLLKDVLFAVPNSSFKAAKKGAESLRSSAALEDIATSNRFPTTAQVSSLTLFSDARAYEECRGPGS
jgi:hypothetical protein